MYRSILVPLDGTVFAEHALPVALSLARHSGARLHLVSVAPPLTEAYLEGVCFSTYDLEEELVARQKSYLETTESRLRERADVAVTTEVKQGEVAAILCKLLAEGGEDLIVMATHGRSAMGRFWFGSIADEVMHQTTRPVLLVRPTDEEQPDLSVEPDMSKVVLPLDGTALAEQILEPATRLASLVPGAEVILVRAIRPLVPVETAPDVPEAQKEANNLMHHVQHLQDRLHDEAEAYLEKVAEFLKAKGLRVRTQVVVEENPEDAILFEADLEHAGLIALETHGRKGFSRMIHGSVADRVVRGAHVPVLVQRPVGV